MQVGKNGWGEKVHHIPHTWVNSCKEAGLSRVGDGAEVHSLRSGQIHAEEYGWGASRKPGPIF